MFDCTIDNQSKRLIKSITIRFVYKITILIGCHSWKNKTDIREITFNQCEVLPFTQKNFSNLKLKIPCVCPSLQNMSTYIETEYMFEFWLNIDESLSAELKNFRIPIEIGTIPTFPINGSSTSEDSNVPQVMYKKMNSGKDNNDDGQILRKNEISGFSPTYQYYTNLP